MYQQKASIHLERNDKIIELYRSGYTLQEVGDMYGITRQRVQQILHPGEKKPKKNVVRNKGIVEKFTNGMTKAQIAEFYGVSREVVHYILKIKGVRNNAKNKQSKIESTKSLKSEIATNKQSHQPKIYERKHNSKIKIDEDTLIKLYVEQKLSISAIALKLSVSFMTVKSRLNLYKIPLRNYQVASKLVNFYKYPKLEFLTEEILFALYVEQRLTQTQIADLYECSQKAINKRLGRCKIRKNP